MNINSLDKDIVEVILKYSAQDYIDLEIKSLKEKVKDMEEPFFSDNFKREINNLIDIERKKKKKKKIYKLIKRAIYFIICIIAILVIVMLDSRYYKTKIFSYIFKENQECDEIMLDELPEEWDYFYIPEYIPSGYVIKNMETTPKSVIIKFKNEENDYLYFIQNNDLGPKPMKHDKQINEVNVGGNKGYFTKNEQRIDLIWYGKDYRFNLIGKLELKELIKMGESLKIYN
ncbi:DUF4367 domain-containing protein [Defluviitalea phaphyphila]|uniref:DUF4367 domain-containing protein n=1 Tax=Defluviitalea phaphyphila TaxID=1473580 RepID=UPI0007316A62|nr:DUF4367 domain-containing protein [Defluviitalea phaphyphila]